LTLETWFQISIEKTFPSPADLETLLGHPGLSESIGRHNGHALYSLLGVVTRFGPDELYTPHADGIARVLGECGRTTDVGVVLKAAEAYAGVVSRAARSGPEWAQTRVLRDAVLAAMESAQAGAPEVDAALLRDAGAFVRLIGGEAPELNFVWTSEDLGSEAAPEAEPSAGTAPGESAGATTLSGLRGRLVILDFWATWCKPCIAAFPKMDALRERYKDAPVTILGVTSAQGYHMRGTERVSTRREDGTVDEAREHELMKEFIAAHPSLTWPVVFTRQRVFNDDYFVTGIPHLTIIAPDGSVRANTLRPGMPAEDLHRMIDGILAEFGLAMPG
jgi:thiol-disulfide isomerase/thioredoxin